MKGMYLILKMDRASFTVITFLCFLGTSCSDTCPDMIKVEGGTFTMGNNNGEADEQPAHSVTLSSFKISRYEVTVAQYRAFCLATGREIGEAPPWGWNEDYPMVYVTYDDANAYCSWISSKEGINYRLPTEAEWEYAARGGIVSRGYTYSGSNDQNSAGWNFENSSVVPHEAGLKIPNELGIYDMSGNVWEWCSDWYGEYSNTTQNNPQGPSTGQTRVLRGGSYGYPAADGRVTERYGSDPAFQASPYYGFRVVSPH